MKVAYHVVVHPQTVNPVDKGSSCMDVFALLFVHSVPTQPGVKESAKDAHLSAHNVMIQTLVRSVQTVLHYLREYVSNNVLTVIILS